LEGFPQLIVVCVCVLLVSGGLCGVQLAIANIPNAPDVLQPVFMILGAFELLAMGASALLLVFCVIAWPISAVVKRGRTPKDGGE
jgi:hypothetical protein